MNKGPGSIFNKKPSMDKKKTWIHDSWGPKAAYLRHWQLIFWKHAFIHTYHLWFKFPNKRWIGSILQFENKIKWVWNHKPDFRTIEGVLTERTLDHLLTWGSDTAPWRLDEIKTDPRVHSMFVSLQSSHHTRPWRPRLHSTSLNRGLPISSSIPSSRVVAVG